MHHPRHHQQAAAEKRDQPGYRVESAVLNGGDHLNQTDHDSSNKANREQRSADPESRHKHLADDVRRAVGGHAKKPFIREPMVRFQPSTSTNSSSLKGAETMAGGSCTMP